MSKKLFLDPNAEVESLAAELTSVAYPVLLQNGPGRSWVELELRLWHTLTHTLGKWVRELPPRISPEEFASWRKGLVTGLVHSTVFVARREGIQEPLPQVKSELRDAFSSTIACS
ncbi:MAG TPA: hypothetical protein VGZ47_02075 [Gemmataceae bacterium]|jgi:hypothetical protein|nr:hypothetical protein [Gemmataceae bacterium]